MRYGNTEMADAIIKDGLFCAFDACLMGTSTENYTAGVPAALVHGGVYGCAGDGRISSAARADYAEAAAVYAKLIVLSPRDFTLYRAAVAALELDGHADRALTLASHHPKKTCVTS